MAGSLTGSARGWLCVAILGAAASSACSERRAVPADRVELTLEANSSSGSPDLNSPHARHAATTLAQGRVLVCGGSLDGNQALLDGCDVYDPANATWSVWPSLPVPLFSTTLTALEGERVLLAGGIGSVTEVDTAWVGTSDGWSDQTEPIGQRSDATATRFFDGSVLLVGGYAPDEGGVQPRAVLRVADDANVAADQRWKTSGQLRLLNHAATLLQGGHDALITGGDAGDGIPLDAVHNFNVDSEQWQNAARLRVARAYHSATLLEDGRVLVIGGVGTGQTVLAQAELYDPTANKWSAAPSSSARAFHVAGRIGPYVIVAGGKDDDRNPLDTVELFDPSDGSWRQLPRLSAPRSYATISETTTASGEPALLVAGGESPGAWRTADLIAPLLLGRSCSKAADCASNHCADGVCCERDCTGVCEVCAPLTGLCTADVEGQPVEGHGACPSGLTCDGEGACRTSCEVASDCVDGYHCDDDGRCSTDLRRGVPCATDEQCEAGLVCSAGVCCTKRCEGACETCGSDGECRPFAGVPRANSGCSTDFDAACSPSCDGQSSDCVFPVGDACSAASCNASANAAVSAGACDASGQCHSTLTMCEGHLRCDAGECRTRCAGDDGCANGYYCYSGMCERKSQLGAPCSSDAACSASGLSCVDGVCCGEATCPTGSSCDNDDFVCKKLPGIGCSFDSECKAGNCVDGTCCLDSACSAGRTCANPDGICKSSLGEGCKADSVCNSGHCTDGVCCSTASCETGSSCALANQAGTCRTRTGGSCEVPAMCASGHCSEGLCVECVTNSDCAGEALCDRQKHCTIPPAPRPRDAGCGLARAPTSSRSEWWLALSAAAAAGALARRRQRG